MKPKMTNKGITKSSPQWGEWVKIKRKQLRENQQQFGDRFNVSQVAVSDWERGVADPPGNVTWWLIKHPILRDEAGFPRVLGPCNGKCLNHPHLDRNGEITDGK